MPPVKNTRVEIWLFQGKDKFLKKASGKLYGGIVSFPEAETIYPVVWLGQRDYCITNLVNRMTILFYDKLAHSLFKPSEMGNNAASVDMVMQTSQNVILAGDESKKAMGIEESRNTITTVALGLAAIMAITCMVFLYLLVTHYVPQNAATTSVSSTGLGGPSIVPQTSMIMFMGFMALISSSLAIESRKK